MAINNITKADALNWVKEHRNTFPPNKISELILRRCFYGEDFLDIAGEDLSFTMSFIGRAYNITAYGSASNRIKSVFKKYRNTYSDTQIKEAVDAIIQQYPNGIPNEEPKFKELLERSLNNTVTPEANTYAIKISKNDLYRNDDDFMYSTNRTEGNSTGKIVKIVLILVAIIVLAIIVVSLRDVILPIAGVIAVIALAVFVYKRMKGRQKSNSSSLFSQASNGSNRSQRRTSGTGKLSFGRVVGAVAWAGMLLYAASYYHNAGNSSSWSIAAVVVGIVGACVILFGIKKK